MIYINTLSDPSRHGDDASISLKFVDKSFLLVGGKMAEKV